MLAARNTFAPDPANGSAYVQRRGFQGNALALFGRGQAIYSHRRLDGTLDRYVFAGGKMYEWNGGAVCTDVTPAGITIHPTNTIYVLSFFDELVVTDGANQPWVYNPDTGVAELIQAFEDSRKWNTQGPPVVYSGRVFFILKRHGAGYVDGAQNAPGMGGW